MPVAPRKPCRAQGCGGRAEQGGYCMAHQHLRKQRRKPDDRPHSAARGYDHNWRRTRGRYLKQHPLCAECGQHATDVDHIIPKSQGGTDEWHNLQALCHSCHSRKTVTQDGGFGVYGGRG